MDDISEFLLQLYRAARECDPDAFQGWVFDRLQSGFSFTAAFWGAGRFMEDDEHVVPTALHLHQIDPDFLVNWSLVQRADPVVPLLRARPGRALRFSIPKFYAQTPELAEFGRAYGIQSMTVISLPSRSPRGLEWISLYRRSPGALCSDAEKRWIQFLSPHLGEALQINRALNAVGPPDDTAAGHAVAESGSGRVLCADQAFVETLAREWAGFDGRQIPTPLLAAWHARDRFAHRARTCQIRGRNVGALVYLHATKRGPDVLTPRQLEIAQLYALGLSSKRIAQRCQLSPATVRNHLASAFAALGVHSKMELAQRLRA